MPSAIRAATGFVSFVGRPRGCLAGGFLLRFATAFFFGVAITFSDRLLPSRQQHL